MSKRIRVGEETYAALEALKDDDETFDEFFSRLLTEHRKPVHEGAGLWEGTDAAEAARSARK